MSVRIVKASNVADSMSAFIDRITANGVSADEKSIYDGKRNGIFKIGECCVKKFGRPNFINRFVYAWLRKSKARRSFENAVELLRRGIGSPEPFGYSEIRKGLSLTDSYYFCRYIDGSTVRDWDNILKNDALLTAFFDFTKRVYDSGVIHRDYSPGNILYAADADGGLRFWLVDVNRIRFGKPHISTLEQMFTVLTIIPEQNAELCRRFASHAGLDADAFCLAVSRRLQHYLNKKRRLRSLKRIIGK